MSSHAVPAPARNLGRSILALLAGFLVAIVLSLVTDLLLHQFGFYSSIGQPTTSSQLAVATLYRSFYGILSAWVTARLAPYNPMGHALVGGAIGTLIALAGAIGTWNLNLGPHWYPIALVVLALPTAWIGGKIRLLQLQ
ncbi:hypothetical protein [Occallatibacter riparius]|uniref:Uncharacterized protein n=1 Tax=Occallatibacter riparius TaxID=1002689 RepID=A0A9J7BYD7_9BACT|nr:hypothetical protein [Occallatibacter riparius]UWZ86429.1 hypothetical protein MOP44_10900 [Occallatibacter riparius]